MAPAPAQAAAQAEQAQAPRARAPAKRHRRLHNCPSTGRQAFAKQARLFFSRMAGMPRTAEGNRAQPDTALRHTHEGLDIVELMGSRSKEATWQPGPAAGGTSTAPS
ncbi:hypothetical protein VZ52_13615 [Ralstonia mannitolilytica]|nr:hypothetical protein VZ52_13615 [Ralstonia mannitolilytica]